MAQENNSVKESGEIWIGNDVSSFNPINLANTAVKKVISLSMWKLVLKATHIKTY